MDITILRHAHYVISCFFFIGFFFGGRPRSFELEPSFLIAYRASWEFRGLPLLFFVLRSNRVAIATMFCKIDINA